MHTAHAIHNTSMESGPTAVNSIYAVFCELERYHIDSHTRQQLFWDPIGQ